MSRELGLFDLTADWLTACWAALWSEVCLRSIAFCF